MTSESRTKDRKLIDWLMPKPRADAPPPWIVFRRDGGWHIDWDHPGWKQLFRERLEQAMKLEIARRG